MIDLVAAIHAQRTAHEPEQHPVRRQPRKADGRLIANGLHAHHEITDQAADHGAAQQRVDILRGQKQEDALRTWILFSQDAEQHPSQQPPQGSKDGIEINSAQHSIAIPE